MVFHVVSYTRKRDSIYSINARERYVFLDRGKTGFGPVYTQVKFYAYVGSRGRVARNLRNLNSPVKNEIPLVVGTLARVTIRAVRQPQKRV